MIRPEDCGPLPEYAEAMMAEAEAAVDESLKKFYNTKTHEPMCIFFEVNNMRVCGDLRIFREFITRYESAGWECVWLANSIDGMRSPYLVAKGKYAAHHGEGEEP